MGISQRSPTDRDVQFSQTIGLSVWLMGFLFLNGHATYHKPALTLAVPGDAPLTLPRVYYSQRVWLNVLHFARTRGQGGDLAADSFLQGGVSIPDPCGCFVHTHQGIRSCLWSVWQFHFNKYTSDTIVKNSNNALQISNSGILKLRKCVYNSLATKPDVNIMHLLWYFDGSIMPLGLDSSNCSVITRYSKFQFSNTAYKNIAINQSAISTS